MAQQKRFRILIFIVSLFALVGLTIWLSYYIDRMATSTTNVSERKRIAKEVLVKNKDYIIKYAEKIKQTDESNLLKLISTSTCECIIDSLTPRFAAIYPLSDLKELNSNPSGSLKALSALLNENQQIWRDCILATKR